MSSMFIGMIRCVCGRGIEQDQFCLSDGAMCCLGCYMFANEQVTAEEDAARLGFDLDSETATIKSRRTGHEFCTNPNCGCMQW